MISRDDIKKSRPMPWLGLVMGLVLLWFLSPVHEWVLSLADNPVPSVIEPELVRAGIRGTDAKMSSDGIVAALETRQKLVISDRLRQRVDLNHDEDITWFRFTRDGQGLVIRAGDTVRLWDTKGWAILHTWMARDFGPPEATVAINLTHIVTAVTPGDSSGTVAVRQLVHGEASERTIALPLITTWYFQMDPSGRCLVGVGDKKLILIDATTGEIIYDRDCAPGRRLCVSPDLRYVAWNNRHGQLWLTQDYVTVLDRETGETVEIHDREPISISHFSADSQRLVLRMGASLAVYRMSLHGIESVLANSANVDPMETPEPLAVYGLSSEGAATMMWTMQPL